MGWDEDERHRRYVRLSRVATGVTATVAVGITLTTLLHHPAPTRHRAAPVPSYAQVPVTYEALAAGTAPAPVTDGPSLQTRMIDPGPGWRRNAIVDSSLTTASRGRAYVADASWTGSDGRTLLVSTSTLDGTLSAQASQAALSALDDAGTRHLADGATEGVQGFDDVAVLASGRYEVEVHVTAPATDDELAGFVDAQLLALSG